MQFEHIGKSRSALTFYPTHQHPTWELIYNHSGTGTMIFGENHHTFSEGTIVLVPPGVPHCKTADGEFADYYIHFSGFELPPRVYLLEDDFEKKIFHLLQILYSTYYENRPRSICDSLFEGLMGLLTADLDTAPLDTYVQMLKAKIISEFPDPDFQLKDAWKVIPVNGDHLRRRFKAALGMTPHAYLTQMRMEHAKQLLSQGNPEALTISQVAFRSGYYDPLYFSRAFKKYTGIMPSQWK